MFTGIVLDTGRVVAVEDLADEARRLRIASSVVAPGARSGESICVNGVCLTVVDPAGDEFGADVMKETLDRSSLGRLRVDDAVNLEPAMAVGDRFGGHIVSGHVDAQARLRTRTDSEHWRVLEFEAPPPVRKYIAEKGSVALDGVSLTVADVGADWFTVSLIPTTLRETTLGAREVGDLVNLEVDMLARYVERMLEQR
jgi:riboflavin synthase